MTNYDNADRWNGRRDEDKPLKKIVSYIDAEIADAWIRSYAKDPLSPADLLRKMKIRRDAAQALGGDA